MNNIPKAWDNPSNTIKLFKYTPTTPKKKSKYRKKNIKFTY